MAKKRETKIWLSAFIDTLKFYYSPGMSFKNALDFFEFYQYKEKQFSLTEAEDARFEQLRDILIDFSARAQNYLPLDKKNLPDVLYLDAYEGKWRGGSPFNVINGFMVITEETYNVLQQFNLGNTQFSRLEVRNIKNNQPIDSDDVFYFFNPCEYRTFFLPEHRGENVDAPLCDSNDMWGNPPAYRMGLSGGDKNDYVLADDAIDCDVDIWHDPLLSDSIFMKNAVHDALIAAGQNYRNRWKFVPCRTLSDITGVKP